MAGGICFLNNRVFRCVSAFRDDAAAKSKGALPATTIAQNINTLVPGTFLTRIGSRRDPSFVNADYQRTLEEIKQTAYGLACKGNLAAGMLKRMNPIRRQEWAVPHVCFLERRIVLHAV